ncbi:Acyl-CoA synthetase (AMP-forming)/AMP-acid ligase II [Nocardia farcinica]|uniref:Short-chain-fatty-acid--CoA ligase n=1 Tax=Nocardia farcinica TaxID=37329 RepID=A0A0H5NKB9_NOCFR|nr:class I adenylate-forming enzyme family protein [Nocardia farcinica]AXK85182.1 acyl-CoA synthetase [Nocardia farcinica]PFX10386.1 Salicylyl-CoA synthase / salicylate adenylyltransferase [Nocardia farcinica]CRY76395.1 Short-chain-fatty-acid--CoA ligase [Nocardia farcinica]SIS76283.1 Acyl-CoA synthetase (AMP-forming)/AMP-acid ligase II [Nocardia farcinica]
MKVLAKELIERCRQAPGTLAVVDEHGAHTLAEIVTAAEELASRLAEIDTRAPTVLVQADNTWRTVAAALAVGLRGGVVAVFSPHASAAEFRLAVEDIDPDVVVGDVATLAHWAVPESGFPVGAPGFDTVSVRAKPGFGDVTRWRGGAAIAMTSGSTGRPKCVVQSEEAIRYACDRTIEAVGLRAGEGVGAFVPLSSVAAFCFGLYLPAHLGGHMVCVGRWSPAAALAAMHELRVAWTMLVPTMALQLSVVDDAAGKLGALRAMTVGGGPMNERALAEAESVLGTTFLRVFGMSECLGHTTPRPDDPPAIRLGRDGRPFPGTVVRAVGGDGNPLPPGEIGDAQVKGPSLFVGYARHGVPVPPELTPDGFLPTGDLVEVAADGSIRVMGRQKQIIIRGGRNIDINEMEAALAALPGVVQVCVVPVPDDLLGERAAALIVTGGAPLTLAEVTERLAVAGVPKAKWPEYVFTVPDLPQNRVGKLSRPDAVRLATQLATLDPSSSQVR